MSYLKEITKTNIEQELENLRRDFKVSQATLIELVRANYEDYVEMFTLLKAQGIGCYDHLVEFMRREHGLETTVSALRATFHTVRMERGERVFKRTGEAFSNKHWDTRSSVTPVFQEHAQDGIQKPQRLRYSRSGGAARSNPSPVPRVKRVGPVERLAASVAVPGETQPGGEPGGVVWTWDEDEPVFQGVKLKVFGSVPLVDKLKVIGRQVEEIAALWPLEDVRSTREFLVRYMAATGHQSMKNGDSYVEVNWPGYAVQLLDRLQDRLFLKQ